MKVLHVLKSDRFSGAENVVCQIINMFSDCSDIRMAYCSQDGPIRDVLQRAKIDYYPMHILCQREIRRVIREYRPDIIHAHDFSASMLCSVSTQIPIICHLHNNVPWIKKYGFKSFAFMLSCIRYKKILTVSDSIQQEYIFRKVIQKKVYTLGNPINGDSIRELAALNIEDSKSFDVIFLGRLATPKNPLRFLRLMKRLSESFPTLTAALVGEGSLRKDCETLIEQFQLNHTVSMFGFLENPFPLLSRGKILCIPSEWEGFGLVAVEAMTLGCPVVSSPVGGLTQIVTKNCGMCCHTDDEFYKEMLKLLIDKEYYEFKRVGAVAQAKIYSNWPAYKKKIEDVYSFTISDKVEGNQIDGKICNDTKTNK